jgi:hypothetical protein
MRVFNDPRANVQRMTDFFDFYSHGPYRAAKALPISNIDIGCFSRASGAAETG